MGYAKEGGHAELHGRDKKVLQSSARSTLYAAIVCACQLACGPTLEPCSRPHEDVFHLDGFYRQIWPFLERFYDSDEPFDNNDLRGKFSSEPGGRWDVYGATDVAYISWILDELETRSTEEGRRDWAKTIQSCQSESTGKFDACDEKLSESATHATAMATAGLKLLGDFKPLYKYTWLGALLKDRRSIEDWLNSFNWNLIWVGSHEIGAAAALLDNPNGGRNVGIDPQWDRWISRFLQNNANPNNGFWMLGLNRWFSTTVDLGGASHFHWVLHELDQPIPYPENLVRTILDLQSSSGWWGNELLGGNFPQGIDFDAFISMRLAIEQDNRLPPGERAISADTRERVLKSMQRYACSATRTLNADGAVDEYFKTPHKLVGTLNTIAELNLLHTLIVGSPAIRTPYDTPWRSTLTVVTWQ